MDVSEVFNVQFWWRVLFSKSVGFACLTFFIHRQYCSQAMLVEKVDACQKLLLMPSPSSSVTADWVSHCVHAPDQQNGY
jgi:hypothetical protein